MFHKMTRAGLVPAALAATLFAECAYAEEQRAMDAHVHGTSEVQMAIEGTSVSIALQAPGADLVGFEHHPETSADKAAMERAEDLLSRPLALFGVPETAGCEVAALDVVHSSQGDDAQDHDAHDHDEHAHDDHDHDHEAHAHAGDEAGESHLEFRANYTLSCTAPEKLAALNVTFFDVFEGARRMRFEVLSADGAKAFELERSRPHLALKPGS